LDYYLLVLLCMQTILFYLPLLPLPCENYSLFVIFLHENLVLGLNSMQRNENGYLLLPKSDDGYLAGSIIAVSKLVVLMLIEWTHSFVHLGYTIIAELTDKGDILHKRCNFIGQVNNVLCYFLWLDADIRHKLFRSYCSSIFGCKLWCLHDSNINQFCTAWRTGLRRVWKIPNTAHSDLVHMLSDELPIFDEICQRSLLFIHKCFFHSSNLVQFVARYGVSLYLPWGATFISVYLVSNLTSGPFLMDNIFCKNNK